MGICPDHPHYLIKIPFGMLGGLLAVDKFQVSSTSAEQLPNCEVSKFG